MDVPDAGRPGGRGCRPGETDDLIDLIRTARDVDVAAVAEAAADGRFKVSVRSRGGARPGGGRRRLRRRRTPAGGRLHVGARPGGDDRAARRGAPRKPATRPVTVGGGSAARRQARRHDVARRRRRRATCARRRGRWATPGRSTRWRRGCSCWASAARPGCCGSSGACRRRTRVRTAGRGDDHARRGRRGRPREPSDVTEDRRPRGDGEHRWATRSRRRPRTRAVKVGGRKLYEAAREGECWRQSRARSAWTRSTSSRFALPTSCSVSRARVGRTCACSLADVGSALSCGAHLTGLRRTAIGALAVADAVAPARPCDPLADRGGREPPASPRPGRGRGDRRGPREAARPRRDRGAVRRVRTRADAHRRLRGRRPHGLVRR